VPELQINVRADLYRIAAHAVSTEHPRPYLGGVFIEPREEGGVTLVSTDGHRLIAVLDETGTATSPAIVRLSPAAMRECKLTRRDIARSVHVVGDEARIYASKKDDKRPVLVGACGRCVIDAVYPDWRRVIPSGPIFPTSPAAFAPRYLQGFSAIAPEIGVAFDARAGSMALYAKDDREPAVIRWGAVSNVFGVLMPMRLPDHESNSVPGFARRPDAEAEASKAA
jgi:DNA polymerase III sliding clamp (beta) subunit (PCNA family)